MCLYSLLALFMIYDTSRLPGYMVQIVLYMYEGKVLMDMLFSFKNKYHYTTRIHIYSCPPTPLLMSLLGMTSCGWVEASLPVEGGK